MMPLREPSGLPKSVIRHVSCTVRRIPNSLGGRLTDVPVSNHLKGVDHLRIETRGKLDTHASGEQHEVEVKKIGLLVEGLRVLGGETRHDGIGLLSRSSSSGHDEGCVCLLSSGVCLVVGVDVQQQKKDCFGGQSPFVNLLSRRWVEERKKKKGRVSDHSQGEIGF